MQFDVQRDFLHSRAGRGYLVFMTACALFSAAIGYGLYYSNLRWYEASKTEEKLTALELVDAFISTYSGLLAHFPDSQAPVPQTFRAHAIEAFNQSRDPNEHMRLVLVGVPGRQIRLAPADADMAEAIRGLVENPEHKPTTRRVTIDGQPFLRTMHPSIAREPSCVECHNTIQRGEQHWQLGDMMGAFALDVPLTSFLRKSRREAVTAALAIFVVGCAVGLHLFLLQFRRLIHEIQQWTYRRLTDAIENLSDGFAIYDSERRLVICNAAYQKHAALSDKLRRSPGRAPRQQGADAREVALPNETWLSVREIGTRSGDTVRIETDISALKRREKELVSAKELAEHASRTKSNFLALMSHELRTPLNAIIGFSEIISREMLAPLDHRYRNYADDIHQSGHYLLKVINDILDMAKVEAGKIELLETPIDLSATIGVCLRVVQASAKAGDVRLQTEVFPGLRVRADEMRLKQIVLNLLSNGVKFTPAGGTVSVSASIDVQGSAVIRVTDTGIGMTAEEIPKALSPFEQADASISRRFGGTGLGLPLSKALAELHGGSLEIASERGKGTSVTVRLPRQRVLTEPRAIEEARAPVKSAVGD